MQAEIQTTIPDETFYTNLKQKKPIRSFTGKLIITNLDDKFISGFDYKNSRVTGLLEAGSGSSSGGRMSGGCVNIDYFSIASYIISDGREDLTYFGPQIWIYGVTYCTRVLPAGYNGGIVEADHAIALQSYDSSGGLTDFPNADALFLPGYDNTLIVNIADHVDCFLQTDENRFRYEITFYADQPGQGGSGSINILGDPGHAFVTFRRISFDNGSIIERTFGFYPEK